VINARTAAITASYAGRRYAHASPAGGEYAPIDLRELPLPEQIARRDRLHVAVLDGEIEHRL
jgi:hypothetical protein